MQKHITLIAALNIGLSIITILIAMIVFTAIVGGGIISGDNEAMFITSIVGTSIAGFLILISIPGIIGGIGLLKGCSWARILIMIVAVLDLFNIPIGTLIGAYTLWVLVQDETTEILSRDDN